MGCYSAADIIEGVGDSIKSFYPSEMKVIVPAHYIETVYTGGVRYTPVNEFLLIHRSTIRDFQYSITATVCLILAISRQP